MIKTENGVREKNIDEERKRHKESYQMHKLRKEKMKNQIGKKSQYKTGILHL